MMELRISDASHITAENQFVDTTEETVEVNASSNWKKFPVGGFISYFSASLIEGSHEYEVFCKWYGEDTVIVVSLPSALLERKEEVKAVFENF